jgi:hypothetical protein
VETKHANLYQIESGVGWHAGHQVKTSRKLGGSIWHSFVLLKASYTLQQYGITVPLYLKLFTLSIGKVTQNG